MIENYESMSEEELAADNSWRMGYQLAAVAFVSGELKLNGEEDKGIVDVMPDPKPFISDIGMYYTGAQAALNDFGERLLEFAQD